MTIGLKKNQRCYICDLIRPITGNDKWCGFAVCAACAPFVIIASKVLSVIPGIVHPEPGQFEDK